MNFYLTFKKNGNQLHKDILQGKYKPKSVRRAEVLKSNRGVRLLGIPTVIDRMIKLCEKIKGNKMNNYLHWVDKIIFKWCIILFSFMAVLVISSVILRYLFGISFVKVEGAIIYLFMGTTFLGSAIATKDREHIRIGIIDYIVLKKVQVFLRIVDLLVVIFVQVILVKASLQWISIIGDNLDPSLRIPMKYLYVIAPISFILIIYYKIKTFSDHAK